MSEVCQEDEKGETHFKVFVSTLISLVKKERLASERGSQADRNGRKVASNGDSGGAGDH